MNGSARRDVFSGLAVMAFGAAFAAAAAGLHIGSVTNMGGGYFPLAVAAIAIMLGGAIALCGLFAARAAKPDGSSAGSMSVRASIAWRAACAILAGVVVFALFINNLGFVPAVFASVLLSAFADRAARPVATVVLAGFTAGAAWLVFIYGLEINAPAFAWPF